MHRNHLVHAAVGSHISSHPLFSDRESSIGTDVIDRNQITRSFKRVPLGISMWADTGLFCSEKARVLLPTLERKIKQNVKENKNQLNYTASPRFYQT